MILKQTIKIGLLITLVSLSGCATNSSNMRVGTDQSYVSLKDQREAITTVQEYSSLPVGARIIGSVDASRCHRNALQTEPTKDEVLIDLKVAAFAKGADGIMNVKIESVSGLMQNCWRILTGKAETIQLKK